MRDGDRFGISSASGKAGSAPRAHLGDQAGQLEVPGEGDVEHGAVGVLPAVFQHRFHGHPPPAALDDEDGGVEGEAEGRAVAPPQSPPAEFPARIPGILPLWESPLSLCPAVLKEELWIPPVTHDFGIFGRWCDAFPNIVRNARDSWDGGRKRILCQ